MERISNELTGEEIGIRVSGYLEVQVRDKRLSRAVREKRMELNFGNDII